MPISDSDLELLEARIDGALSSDESRALDARLGREPELAEALEAVLAERALRLGAFRALEPDDAGTAALAGGLCAAAFKSAIIRRPTNRWRRPAAVAASLLIFAGGWFGRARTRPSQALVDTRLVSPLPVVSSNVKTVLSYQVALTDETGRVTATQNFDSLEKAQDFARDVGRWQQRREELRNATAPVVVADRF